MAQLNIEKHIVLPSQLKNNTLYLIKNGASFLFYLTNSTGTATLYTPSNAAAKLIKEY